MPALTLRNMRAAATFSASLVGTISDPPGDTGPSEQAEPTSASKGSSNVLKLQ
jgi:hypothetical protein